jgi:predicted nucleic acid-binding protein
VILVDTSVWVAHLRHGEPRLARYLAEGLVLMHPWVRGELACGSMKKRESILSDLQALDAPQIATDLEVLTLIEQRTLWGCGLGWIDVHLLVSSLLSGCRLWTLDKRLDRAARELGLL